MTINRHGLVFTNGGTCTGFRIDFSLNIDQSEEKTNWFLLPICFKVISGVIQVKGKVQTIGNQVYFGRLAIPNVQRMDSTIKNLFKVENFEGCFPRFTIYIKKGSNIQISMAQVQISQTSAGYALNHHLYVIRFQL